MKIPQGNFGDVLPVNQGARDVGSTGATAIAQGMQELGHAMQKKADLQEENRIKSELQQSEIADRLESGNALGKAEIDGQALQSDLFGKVKSGQVPLADAEKQLRETWSKNSDGYVAGIQNPNQQALTRQQIDLHGQKLAAGLQKADTEYQDGRVKAALQDAYSQTLTLYNQNPEQAQKRFELSLSTSNLPPDEQGNLRKSWLGKAHAGLAENRLNLAFEAQDTGALQQVRTDLRDPAKFGGLEPSQRETLAAKADSYMARLDSQAKVQTNEREQAAASAMNNLHKQVLTGQPISQALFDQVGQQVSGTSQQTDYANWLKLYNHIARFSALTLPEMTQEYRKFQTADKTSNNPEMRDKIEQTFEQIFKERQDVVVNRPLDYLATVTGKPVEPLNLLQIDTPDGQKAMRARMEKVNAVQAANGLPAGGVIFQKEEVSQLQQMMAASDDAGKLQLVAALAKGLGKPEYLKQTLKAIGGGNSALSIAGMMQASGITTNNTRGRNVPLLVLQGEKVRRDKSFILPPDDLINRAVNDYLEGAVLPGSEAHSAYMEAVRLTYAGLAAQTGTQYDPSVKPDVSEGFQPTFKGKLQPGKFSTQSELLQTAIELAVGGVSVHAGANVLRPYGMSDVAFTTQIDSALKHAAATQGVKLSDIEDMRLIPTGSPTVFQISDGRGGVQVGKGGKPVVIAIDPRVK